MSELRDIENEYLKNKIIFLNEIENEIGETTKNAYESLMKSYVISTEISKMKDLYYFEKDEIEDLIKYAPTTSIRTKRSLFSAISRYISWACDRGYNYVGNPCDSIDVQAIYNMNVKAIKKDYLRLDEFYKLLDELKYEGEKHGKSILGNDKQSLVIILMMRYGIPTSLIPYVKEKNINRDNKTLTLYDENNEFQKVLDIDDLFINYIDSTIKETVQSGEYLDSEYVLRNISNKRLTGRLKNADTISFPLLHKRYNRVFSNHNKPRIGTTQLIKSRKFDYLFDILEKKNEVTIKDIKETVYATMILKTDKQKKEKDLYKYTSPVYNLKNDFELISGIEVK